MAPAAPSQGSTTNQSSETSPPWSTVAAVFIILFGLTLLAGGLSLRRLARGRNLPPPSSSSSSTNPHPFGTEAWRGWEDDRCPRSERDALAIASLEAQVGMLEEAGGYLDRTVELLEGRNRALSRELAEERRRYEPVDPEVMRRACEFMHVPIVQQQRAQTPQARPVLQLAKVRVIMDENSRMSPERTTHVVESAAGLQVRSCAASVVDDPFADGHEADEDSCSGNNKAESA